MSGAMSGSLIGLVYNGKYEKEHYLTVVKHLAYEQWHVCLWECNNQKRIIAVTESEELANDFVKAIDDKYAIVHGGGRLVVRYGYAEGDKNYGC